MIILKSRDPNSRQMFAHVVLIFDQKKSYEFIEVVDDSGDFTEIFKNFQINQPIKVSVFK